MSAVSSSSKSAVIIDNYTDALSCSGAINLIRDAWLKENPTSSSNETLQFAVDILLKGIASFKDQPPDEQQAIWRFKIDFETNPRSTPAAVASKIRAVIKPLLPITTMRSSRRRELPVLPQMPTYQATTAATAQKKSFLSKLRKSKVDLEDDFTDIDPAAANTLNDPTEAALHTQKQYMRCIITLFIDDYLMPRSGDMDLEALRSNAISDQIQPALIQFIEEVLFPTEAKRVELQAALIRRLFESMQRFSTDLAAAFHAVRTTGTTLLDKPIAEEENLLLGGINAERAKRKLQPVITPDMDPAATKKRVAEAVEQFILNVAKLAQTSTAQISSSTAQSIRSSAPTASSSAQTSTAQSSNTTAKKPDTSFLLLSIIAPLAALKIVEVLNNALSKETLFSLVQRFLRDDFKFESVEQEPDLNSFSAANEEFSRAIGDVIEILAKDLLSLADSKRIAKLGLDELNEYLTKNKKLMGDIVQKSIERVINSPSHIQFFQVFALIFWKGATWEPYLNDLESKNQAAVDESGARDAFCGAVYKKILEVMKSKGNDTSLFRRTSGEIAAKMIEMEGSLQEYSRTLSLVFFRILQQRRLMFTLLIYLLDAFKPEPQGVSK